MSGMPPRAPEPARGAMAGIKADLERAKASGKAYDPRGHGNAFTHNFLNQKPWHPMNFRNQVKKFEAEQKKIAEEKLKEQAIAEFQAEQETMRSLSYLSEAEQQRYKERQSISFMYMKPPGLDAALAKEAAAAQASTSTAVAAGPSGDAAGGGAAAGSGAGGGGGGGKGGKPQLTEAQKEEAARKMRELDKVREDPFAVMLTARANLQKNERFVIKQAGGPGDAAHGGFSQNAANQQLLIPQEEASATHQVAGVPAVVADADDLAVLASMSEGERAAVLRQLRKMQRKAEKQQQLEQAQAVLKAAGYNLDDLPAAGGASKSSSKSHKKKSKSSKSKSSKHKSKKRHKGDGQKSSKGRAGSGSSSGSSSSGSEG